jgi:Helix-hairpin-helix motif
MKMFIVCLFSLFLIEAAAGQEKEELPRNSPPLELLLENNPDDDAERSSTLDALEFYRSNPIDINTATFQELTEVPFLPSIVAGKIIGLRDSLGSLSIVDLRAIPELDGQTMALVSQFFTFGKDTRGPTSSADSPGSSRISFRSRVTSDLQLRKAFRQGDYFGNRFREYDRLEFISARAGGGILYDKDAGEKFSDGFVSGYIGFDDVGILKKLVIGNYTLNAGEGLTISGFRSSSKGGDALLQIKSTGRTIVPHLSTDEFHYFHGVAATADFYPLALTVFLSKKKTDATVDSSNTARSFYTSGLFRSGTELEKRDVVEETAAGVVANIRVGRMHRIGAAILRSQYDKNIGTQSSHNSQGSDLSVIGANANFVFDSFSAFGEVAGNSWESRSAAVGFIYQVSRRLSVASQMRSYANAYANSFAYGFGEQNGTVNGENGRYFGLEYRPSNGVKISLCSDEFTLPEIGKFTVTGSEYVVRYEHTITKSLSAFVQYKEKSKVQENSLLDEDHELERIVQARHQESIRASMTYTINKWMELSQRIEWTRVGYSVSRTNEQGMLMFAELTWSFPSPRLFGNTRFAIYETHSYDSRLYEFEGDVRGGYSFPALYGRGIRWYVVFGCKVLAQAEISFKYSETLKSGAATLGSGDSEISGPLDNRVTFQLDVVL